MGNIKSSKEDGSNEQRLVSYRKFLVSTLTLLNQSYDKLVVTLAGGSLAISITFLKDVIALEEAESQQLLLWAWIAFVVSLATVLGRIIFGMEAFRYAIQQVDDGTIDNQNPGGKNSIVTRILYISSAGSLLVGLILIALFAYANIGVSDVKSRAETQAQTTTSAAGRAQTCTSLSRQRTHKPSSILGTPSASAKT